MPSRLPTRAQPPRSAYPDAPCADPQAYYNDLDNSRSIKTDHGSLQIHAIRHHAHRQHEEMQQASNESPPSTSETPIRMQTRLSHLRQNRSSITIDRLRPWPYSMRSAPAPTTPRARTRANPISRKMPSNREIQRHHGPTTALQIGNESPATR